VVRMATIAIPVSSQSTLVGCKSPLLIIGPVWRRLTASASL
jgi:hypothetical protein